MKRKHKVITGVFVGLNLFLIFLFLLAPEGWFVQGIKVEVDKQRNIRAVEKRVIERLRMVRDAQIAYQSHFGLYTGSWESLIRFIRTDSLYITERHEEIITLDYGADSVQVVIDTVGRVSVMDSVFSQYGNFDFEQLKYAPETGAPFELWVGRLEKGGFGVDAIEVKDTKPFNPDRNERNELRARKPLRFGDREEVTTSGNWE
ncbi:MAG: hypothetical protein OXB93_06970 [Cytophagales bacterium]|nr:hypothetical protein [Cytophagales bacterium]